MFLSLTVQRRSRGGGRGERIEQNNSRACRNHWNHFGLPIQRNLHDRIEQRQSLMIDIFGTAYVRVPKMT